MGLLTTAGLVSGAGEGLSRAAQTAQQGAISSELLRQRDATEDKRLEKTQQFAREQSADAEALALEREKRGYAHTEGLLQTKLGSDIVQRSQELQATADEKAKDRSSVEGIHKADRESKEGLADKEVNLKSKYYSALADYYSGKNSSAGTKGGVTNETKKSTEYLKDILNERLKGLHKMLELATPDERDEINSQIDDVMTEARKVSGIEGPSASGGMGIVDPFAKKQPVPGGR